jgi:Transposase.
MSKRRKRHTPEQIVKKLRDADALLNSGQDLSAVLQHLEVNEATYHRWRNQFGGMKSEEAKRLKELEDENKRLKHIVADQALDIQMLKYANSKNFRYALPAMNAGSFAAACCAPVDFKTNSWSQIEVRSWCCISHGARSDLRDVPKQTRWTLC